jgi:polysaccharide export outer membrane protein
MQPDDASIRRGAVAKPASLIAGESMKSLTWMHSLLMVSVVLCAACVSGCSSSPSLPAFDATSDGAYRLDSGDQLRIIVFGQEELTGKYTVDGAGKISMPLIPMVQARGFTTAELEQEVTRELKNGVVIAPSVSVQIEAFRPFFILGEVRRPGHYPYVHGMTVLTAVAIAGGFSPRAQEDYVSITRTIGESAVEARAKRQALVRPGDVIYVRERFF